MTLVAQQPISAREVRPPADAAALRHGLHDFGGRMVDMVAAGLLLLFVMPLMAAISVLVFTHDGGAPIFAQRRVGKDGRQFHCLKFRSMVPGAEDRLGELLAADPAARAEWDRDHKLRRDPRITRLGHFLRKTSLDELPQLFNVLRGDMSLVGPRPIVPAEIERYGRHFATYCSVRPGLTGLWQVSGRNDVSYRRRVAMDVVYARNRCLALYLHVLAATVPAVLMRRGAS